MSRAPSDIDAGTYPAQLPPLPSSLPPASFLMNHINYFDHLDQYAGAHPDPFPNYHIHQHNPFIHATHPSNGYPLDPLPTPFYNAPWQANDPYPEVFHQHPPYLHYGYQPTTPTYPYSPQRLVDPQQPIQAEPLSRFPIDPPGRPISDSSTVPFPRTPYPYPLRRVVPPPEVLRTRPYRRRREPRRPRTRDSTNEATGTDTVRPPTSYTCFACLDEHPVDEIAYMPCPNQHKICTECLNQLFRVGTSNRESFPPKCCNAPLRLVDYIHHLKAEVQARYHEVYAEYSSKAPLYCADGTCSAFLADVDADTQNATCATCKKETCSKCKMLVSDHQEANTCPVPAQSEQQLKSLMTRKKWKACPLCRNAIERTDGCDHMECTCGADFCYGCGKLLGKGSGCECASGATLVVERTDAANVRMQAMLAQRQITMEDHMRRGVGQYTEAPGGMHTMLQQQRQVVIQEHMRRHHDLAMQRSAEQRQMMMRQQGAPIDFGLQQRGPMTHFPMEPPAHHLMVPQAYAMREGGDAMFGNRMGDYLMRERHIYGGGSVTISRDDGFQR